MPNVKRRRRKKSFVLRVDGSFKGLINKIQREAKNVYGVKLNSQEASRIATKMLKKVK